MLMFYDIICEICMPNSDTILQSHILDMFKIFLFLVVYLIPVVCSSRALLVTRIVLKCLNRHGFDSRSKLWQELRETYRFTRNVVLWRTSQIMCTDITWLMQLVSPFVGFQIISLTFHNHLSLRNRLIP